MNPKDILLRGKGLGGPGIPPPCPHVGWLVPMDLAPVPLQLLGPDGKPAFDPTTKAPVVITIYRNMQSMCARCGQPFPHKYVDMTPPGTPPAGAPSGNGHDAAQAAQMETELNKPPAEPEAIADPEFAPKPEEPKPEG